LSETESASIGVLLLLMNTKIIVKSARLNLFYVLLFYFYDIDNSLQLIDKIDMEEYYEKLIIDLFNRQNRINHAILVRKVDTNSIHELNENRLYMEKTIEKFIANNTLRIVEIGGISYYQLNDAYI
jgi:hypothetical protein